MSELPKLRREVMVPMVPAGWLWTYLGVKAVLVVGAMTVMGLIGR